MSYYESLLAKRVFQVKMSPMRKIAALLDEAKRKRDMISFGGGAPSLLPPKEILDNLYNYVKNNPYEISRYGSTQGSIDLREKISEDVYKYTKVRYDKDEIIITEGSTEGIFLVLSIFLEEGDEVILTDPTYLGYLEVIKFYNAKPVYVTQDPTVGYQPNIEELKEKITKKTKLIILNSPENPTGRIIKEDIARAIVEIAKDKKIFVVVDEAYKHIVYEGRNVYLSQYNKDVVISVCSFSKEASMPGFRLGYVCANKEIISAMEKIKQFVTLCPNMPAQLILINYLASEAKDKYLNEYVIPTYKKRRDFMAKMLKQYLPEAEFKIPEGAFYIFANFAKYIKEKNVEEVTDDILDKVNVVVIPGSYFGRTTNKHFRLTFVSEDEEKIETGIKRLAKYFSQ
ncbi:MAG: pyridoxal phosphate-dependent aminotransferase [Thermoproteota archaeon]